jgi:hypothetical protein
MTTEELIKSLTHEQLKALLEALPQSYGVDRLSLLEAASTTDILVGMLTRRHNDLLSGWERSDDPN